MQVGGHRARGVDTLKSMKPQQNDKLNEALPLSTQLKAVGAMGKVSFSHVPETVHIEHDLRQASNLEGK